MKKLLLYLLFLGCLCCAFAQENDTSSIDSILGEPYDEEYVSYDDEDETYEMDYTEFYNDTITYHKSLDYKTKREFPQDLESTYNGSEFEYVDDLKKEEQQPLNAPSEETIGFLKLFGSFMANIFPYLLGIAVVVILIKTFVKTDHAFWKFKRANKTNNKEMIYQDDLPIDEHDYERLVKKAVQEGDFRMATRYYYLYVLKVLSDKKLINYHKDKTNTEYLFELQETMRPNFSYLSTIYNYVWYGEFIIDEAKFQTIEKKYKHFIKSV